MLGTSYHKRDSGAERGVAGEPSLPRGVARPRSPRAETRRKLLPAPALFLFAFFLGGAFLLLRAQSVAARPAVAPKGVPIAIRDAKVVPVSGPVLDRATVILRDGLIEAVGVDLPIPAGAWVIEGASPNASVPGGPDQLTVYPGLIDAMGQWGLPAELSANGGAAPEQGPAAKQSTGPLDRPATTSWLKAADHLDPGDARLAQARAAGFTSAAVFPMRGILAGQGSLINLGGDRAPEMVLEPGLGQYVAMVPSGVGYPMSLMGSFAYVRQTYLDAAYYARLQHAYGTDPRGLKRPPYDRALEGVLDSPRIFLPADRRVSIERMLVFSGELGEALNRPVVLYGMEEGYRSIDLLTANLPAGAGVNDSAREAGVTVLVRLDGLEPIEDPDPEARETLRVLETRDRAASTAAELARAGVRFAFYSGDLGTSDELRNAVRKAVDAGLAPSQALRALTLTPAEIYGAGDRLGSIEPGKIANLTVTRGDWFDPASTVEMVFVDGKQYRISPAGLQTSRVDPDRVGPERGGPDRVGPEPSGTDRTVEDAKPAGVLLGDLRGDERP